MSARARIGAWAALAAALMLGAPAAGAPPQTAPQTAPQPIARPAAAAATSAQTPVRAPTRPLARTPGMAQPQARPAVQSPSLVTGLLAGREATPNTARAEPDTAPGLALMGEAGLTGRVGFAVIDIATGEMLTAHDAARAFPPASTAKAITAAYALEVLGPEHRFVTELRADGPIKDGALRGALALVGGGDPDLDSDDLADLLRQAAGAGLREAKGGLLADGRALPQIARIDPEQPEEVAYNPSIGGLNLNYNRALFEWKIERGAPVLSMRAAARRTNPAVSAVSIAVAAPGAPVLTRRDAPDGTEMWEVAAGALRRDGQRWLPVRRPDLYAADALRALGPDFGIALPAPRQGVASGAMTAIARHESPELRDIIRGMLRWSTNLTAEALGLAAAQAEGAAPRDLDASAGRMAQWMIRRAGLRAQAGLELHNHSGLDARSRISPAQMAAFLRAAAIGPETGGGATMVAPGGRLAANANPGGLAPLPRAAAYGAPGVAAGVRHDAKTPRGELYALLREAPMGSGKDAPPKGVRAVAKTGTLLFVRGLAGYLDTASGRRVAFAIYAEDLERRAALTDFTSDRSATAWAGRARVMERRLLNAWARRF